MNVGDSINDDDEGWIRGGNSDGGIMMERWGVCLCCCTNTWKNAKKQGPSDFTDRQG